MWRLEELRLERLRRGGMGYGAVPRRKGDGVEAWASDWGMREWRKEEKWIRRRGREE